MSAYSGGGVGDSPNRCFTVKSVTAEHKDLINDVAYNFYGKRMATCSSDQHVKVRCLFIFSLSFVKIVEYQW
jgi:WD40 repeat protein